MEKKRMNYEVKRKQVKAFKKEKYNRFTEIIDLFVCQVVVVFIYLSLLK